MLVFNEGMPRSGKSYDSVKNHILVALKAGRKVYARVNGLDHDRIAAYLSLPADSVRELLILVSTAQVRTLFLAYRDLTTEDQEWRIADELKNALFVIDECHEFYVASRDSINPAVEQFFALCGQNGMDGLLMSQWYRRLHSSVRARIERKNVFQKLTAVGMTGKYNVTRFHTLSPDRFEKIGTETYSYDPLIFPLYKGYADGADNVGVYTAGGRTVWHKIGRYAVFVLPLVGVGIYVFTGFFGPHSGLAKSSSPAHQVQHVRLSTGAPAVGSLGADAGRVAAPVHHHGKMTDEQGYVFDLSDKSRSRLLGVVTIGGRDPEGVIEWREGQGAVLERLRFSQLRDMGIAVQVHAYGVKLVVGSDATIVTAWPVDVQPVPATASQDASAAQGRASAPGSASVSGQSLQWPTGVGSQEYHPPAEPGKWVSDPYGPRGAESKGR